MDKANISLELIDERIDAYIRGEMTAAEETAFQLEIQADPELRSHVLATISVIKSIRTKNEEYERALFRSNTINKTQTFLRWACSIAAVFAVIFAYQKDKRYDELSGIVSPYYTEYSLGDISRGDIDSVKVDQLFKLFYQIQTKRNVSSVIKKIEPIYSSLDTDFTYHAYANDIAWNLALAYIKNDQIDRAIPILENLVRDNQDTPMSVRAKALLKSLQ